MTENTAWETVTSAVKNRKEKRMSWYSDGEPFDEYDDPYCVRIGCAGGDSYEQCRRCLALARRSADADDDEYEVEEDDDECEVEEDE